MRGTYWLHQKTQTIYKVDGLYLLELDGGETTMVAYTNVGSGQGWVRPLNEWHEVVEVDTKTGRCGPRFVLTEPEAPEVASTQLFEWGR
jgi:hypothetical protein